MPQTADGVAAMLVAFDTNAPAYATKYLLTAPELARVTSARQSWQWFLDALEVGRNWGQNLTSLRDSMVTGAPAAPVPLPGGPTLPPYPEVGELESGFFTFFASLVSRIKTAANYDVADGQQLGIEGAEIPPPDPATNIPVLTGDLYSSGHPELTCRKGQFQGYTVWLTRPGQGKKQTGFATTRRFVVEEPLPAAGTAEVWVFEAQYRYQNAPFGQVSQPLNLTVRG